MVSKSTRVDFLSPDEASGTNDEAIELHTRHSELIVDVGTQDRASDQPVSSQRSLSRLRSKRSSWGLLPQNCRGLRMKELLQLYENNKVWLETEEWHCNTCNTTREKCSCSCAQGHVRRPNLYEVVDNLIKPACSELKVSYVEYLSESRPQKDASGVSVDTFVSHWWGEEFAKFVKSLQRYAESRAFMQHSWRWAFLTYVFTTLLIALITTLYLYRKKRNEMESEMECVFARNETCERLLEKDVYAEVWVSPAYNLFIACTITLFTDVFVGRRKTSCLAENWAFWICAFANNQFAIEHALGSSGHIEQSSFATALGNDQVKGVAAILDKEGTIYSRIWCAFELFFAIHLRGEGTRLGPLEISLVNESGVVSDGDATSECLQDMKEIIREVRTEHAQATNPSDYKMINDAITKHTTHQELDQFLQRLAITGINAARLRRRGLLILVCFCPLVSIFMMLSLERGFHSVWVLKAKLQGKDASTAYADEDAHFSFFADRTYYQTAFLFFVLSIGSELGIYFSIFGRYSCSRSDDDEVGGWHQEAAHAIFGPSDEEHGCVLAFTSWRFATHLSRNLAKKAFYIQACLALPLLVIDCIIVLDNLPCTHVPRSYRSIVECMHKMVSRSQLLIAVIGIPVGVVYTCVRDLNWPFWQRFRVALEDRLVA